ncbi:Ankyrin repeat and SOCS box protein 13 [Trichoplax sp. H2]|nr:Ankyrin repeat and SOCS box protein 13 [Trichoplax sp. H2]|eukprot:RDD44087.1 Ankyrin repeat and SOCS box protein 13 [Trichoplax sp. H2]
MGCKQSLIYAAREGREDDLKWLLFDKKISANIHEPETKRTPLHLAASSGGADCVKILLQAGANPNAKEVNGLSPLHLAVYHGRASCVEVLLNNGCKVDARTRFGCTPLHNAAYFEKSDCARLLLKFGADINAVESWGQTPLLLAAQKGSADLLRLLIDHGAAGNIVSKVQAESPLHACCKCLNLECVQMLLDAGADVAIKNSTGRTPLHEIIASGQECEDLVQMLLSYGAPVNVPDNAGSTVIDLVDQQYNRPFATREHLKRFAFLKNIVQSVNGSPMPLSQMCKINIRRSLGPSKLEMISELNFPEVVKESLVKNNYLCHSESEKVDISQEKCNLTGNDDSSKKEKSDIPEDVREAVAKFSMKNNSDHSDESDDELQADVVDDKSGEVKV